MAIIALRGWYIERYEPLSELRKRPHDIRLSRNSLLKAGLRADFLEEREEIEQAEWFNRYLAGEAVEFYIEGSGSYRIANIDLSSHEIYFTKQEGSAYLDPKIFLSVSEGEYGAQLQEALEEYIRQVNRRFAPSPGPGIGKTALRGGHSPQFPSIAADSQESVVYRRCDSPVRYPWGIPATVTQSQRLRGTGLCLGM